MGYLKFEKNLLINLEESLTREILRTNRSGAYHSTTIVDCNTRKYHGLLVIPVPGLDNDNHVLLSSLDPTVVQHGAEFNLAIHQYQDHYFSPNGHKYLRQYDFQTIPKATYRVGGVILTKEVIFSTHENRILIKYTLLDAHSPTILRFRPFMAFRNVNELTVENNAVNKNYTVIENGIKTCMYEGYPELHMQFSKEISFIYNPAWYKNIEYTKEKERGFPCQEDLYVPGHFEMSIEKGESIYFAAGDTFADTEMLETSFLTQAKTRTPRDSFFNCLKNSAEQFYYRPNDTDTFLLAGYPWFKVRCRDLFIALSGCTLAINRRDQFEAIMSSTIPPLRNYYKTGEKHKIISEIDQPDVVLWMICAVQEYAKSEGLERAGELYGHYVQEAVEDVINNLNKNLHFEENGLLWVNGKEQPVSWMNSSVDGKPIVPRTGYLVEFNALWYNAIKFSAEFAALEGNAEKVEQLEALAEKVSKAFIDTFLNGFGYLFDYVDGSYVDWSVRPNMLFAISLNYSPLDRQQRRSILNIITKELLTPKGIRSLSPKSEGYMPYYSGSQRERDLAYHQGTAWPWLIAPYIEAYLKLYQYSGVSFAERILIGLDDEMNSHCISTLSELFDGNPPFQSRGAISFAMNVASILKALKLIDSYNQSN